MESFYVNLISTESLKTFPRNKAVDFWNVLPKEISMNIENYEVALTTLIYTKTIESEDNRSLLLDSDDTISILVPTEEETKFTLLTSVDYLLPTSEETILNVIRENIRKSNHVKLLTDYDADGRAHVKVKVDIPNSGIFVIDSKLADILGFRGTIFKNGLHKAEYNFNATQLYNKI